MKTLRRFAFAILFACCCTALADDARPAQLYSFADLYRLTVHASPDALVLAPQAPSPQMRVAMDESFAEAQPRFTVTQVPSPNGWMLVLAGLAAASWVAHRRLTSAY